MIQTDELSFFCLPENRFYKVIFLFIPGLKIIFYQTAGVSGICVKTPECMVKMLFGDQLPEVFHPLQIIAFHKTAPLTDEYRRYSFILDIKPVFVPCILHEGIISEASLKPGLFIYSRAVIVR